MRQYEVSIELTAHPRFNAQPCSFTPRESLAYNSWRREALPNKWVRKSRARHSCRPLFVPKKSGELRFCINFIPLNKITKSMTYAPRLDRALRTSILASTWYAKLDLKNAFHHVIVREEDRWKTAFRTPHGIYEWNVLPFGLKNAPGEFQRLLEDILAPVLGDNVTVHIDDILIHTDTKRHCSALLDKVRKIVTSHGFIVNEAKSTTPSTAVDFCGFHYEDGKQIAIGRTDTVRTWPTPRNQTQVRQFLGLTLHFRDNVPRYSHLAQPLYTCTGKTWLWTNQQTRAFQSLKAAVCAAIQTCRMNPTKECTLTTDASLFAAGAILTQESRIIAIWSRAFSAAERNYTANERELLAVVEALDTWQFQLECCPAIHVRTDNMINAQNIKPSSRNRRINRWILRLSAYNLTWTHVPGKDNPADAPSRRPDYKRLPSSEKV